MKIDVLDCALRLVRDGDGDAELVGVLVVDNHGPVVTEATVRVALLDKRGDRVGEETEMRLGPIAQGTQAITLHAYLDECRRVAGVEASLTLQDLRWGKALHA